MSIQFSNWLNDRIVERDMSSAEFARRCHHHRGVISNLLSGKRNPQAETCLDIAKALRVSEEEVLRAAGYLNSKSVDMLVERAITLFDSLKQENSKLQALQFLEFLLTVEERQERAMKNK